MRRFYKDVDVSESQNTFRVLLDGKPIKTPQRSMLALPTRELADAIAEEWRGQGETIKSETMPLTRLANAAIDTVSANGEATTAQIHAYANSDLLCYRATEPPELIARQAAQWDPLLEWAQERFSAPQAVVSGIVHAAQPPEVLAAMRRALDVWDAYALAAIHNATTITGSLVLALALAEGRLGAAEAFALSQLDDSFQAEKWGHDAEAETRAARLLGEMEAAERFLRLNHSRPDRP